MDLRDGRNNVPAGPSDTVFIDQNTPTTGGVVFDPNTPALTDTLYVSTTNGSTWIYNGSAYTTYTAPAVEATPFYVAGTDIDAGSNKKAIIERSGEVRVKNSTVGKIKTISGTRSLLLSSYVSSRNEILSTGDQLWLGTSDNNPFYLRTNGVERLRVLGTGAIRFNQAYSFPTTDGTVGQVLKTDGAGVVSFGTAAGGLTYFTEAQNTTAPNATVPVDSLTAVTATTNGDIAIVPKGTGAFTLAVPDNTTVGGNKRGINAVDLQTSRTNAAQVASGQYSFVSGRWNTASGDYSTAMGVQNIASGGLGCLAIGYGSTASGSSSVATGASTASGATSFASGNGNLSSGESSIALGANNTSSGVKSFVCGNNSVASGEYSMVMGYFASAFGLKGRWVTGQTNTSLGDAQKSIFILSIRTTDTTATTLTSGFGSGAPSAINQVILQNQNALRFKGTIIGKKSGTTDIAAWDVDGLIVRGANAAATTLVVSNVNLVSNTPAWGTPTLAADTTNGGLRVQAIGFATTNIQWTCTIETTEVIYA